MSNNFKIVISATDKATSSIRKINDSISRMTRPFANVQRSMGALGKELGRNPAVKALNTIGRAAGGVAVAVAKIAAPMAAVVGVGSLAAVAALATEWGHLGFEIGKTAANLGMATFDLQSLRGAAQLAGVSSEELTGGLKSLGDTMEDALYGRNQSAVLLLTKMGVGIHKTAEGSIDAARGFKDIATYISNIKNAQVQGLIARQFGLESSLPLLRKGAQGIQELQDKVYGFGGVKSNAAIASAEEFGKKLLELKVAANGLKTEIGSALMPVLQPLIESFTNWIALNREPIGKQIGEWAEKFAKWIRETDFSKLGERIEKIGHIVVWVIDKISLLIDKFDKLNGGGGPAKYGLGGVPRLLYDMVAKDDPAPKNDRRTASGKIGYPDAPLKDEPAAKNDRRTASGKIGYPDAPLGIRTNNPLNMQPNGQQAVFASPEEGITAGIRNIMRNYQGLTLAQFVHKYAPGDAPGNSPASEAGYLADLSGKTGIAPNQVPNLSDVKTLAPLISAMIQHENGQNPYGKDMINDAVSHVVVEFKNAPPGTSAVAKTKTGADVPVRINHSMPTLAAG